MLKKLFSKFFKSLPYGAYGKIGNQTSYYCLKKTSKLKFKTI